MRKRNATSLEEVGEPPLPEVVASPIHLPVTLPNWIMSKNGTRWRIICALCHESYRQKMDRFVLERNSNGPMARPELQQIQTVDMHFAYKARNECDRFFGECAKCGSLFYGDSYAGK